MSWEVWIIRTKTNIEEYNNINESNCIPISKDELLASWKTITQKMNVFITDEKSDYPHLRGNAWSIEAYFADECVADISLQIRGNECPAEVLGIMAELLKARVFDTSTGKFLDDMKDNGFDKWMTLNQRCINETVAGENV